MGTSVTSARHNAEQGQSAFLGSLGASASSARQSAQEVKEKVGRRAERAEHVVAEKASDANKASQGMGGVGSMMKQAEHKARQRSEEVQQKAAHAAMGSYVNKASGGLVTNVPPGVSNAALGYAKQNPKDAMK